MQSTSKPISFDQQIFRVQGMWCHSGDDLHQLRMLNDQTCPGKDMHGHAQKMQDAVHCPQVRGTSDESLNPQNNIFTMYQYKRT